MIYLDSKLPWLPQSMEIQNENIWSSILLLPLCTYAINIAHCWLRGGVAAYNARDYQSMAVQ